jgi:ribosomal protein S18 acetylase RimI-like enzyme
VGQDTLRGEQAAPPSTIRRAEERDVPAMAALRAETWETSEYWVKRIGPYLAGQIGAKQALGGCAMFVAEIDGAIVGFVAGHRTTRHGCQGELEWIDVTRARRRGGIAGRLLAAMAAWLVEHNALRVCVDVDPENAAARAFYAKHGATDLKPHWMIWEDISTVIAAQ